MFWNLIIRSFSFLTFDWFSANRDLMEGHQTKNDTLKKKVSDDSVKLNFYTVILRNKLTFGTQEINNSLLARNGDLCYIGI